MDSIKSSEDLDLGSIPNDRTTKPLSEKMKERLVKAKPQFTKQQLEFAKNNVPKHLFHGKDKQ